LLIVGFTGFFSAVFSLSLVFSSTSMFSFFRYSVVDSHSPLFPLLSKTRWFYAKPKENVPSVLFAIHENLSL